MKFSTKAIRIGQDPDPAFMAVTPPIYQTSTFAWKNLDALPSFDYTRCGNPNAKALEEVLAALENGKYAQVFASGMAAVMGAFCSLKMGDHLLLASDIYGGTHRLAYGYLAQNGIETSEFNASQPESIASQIRPNTKLAIFESPTNPNVRVMDIAQVASVFKAHGITTVFDNTFASPYLQNPLDLGIDVVIHSTTKYLGGHSDLIGGAVITNSESIYTATKEFIKATGAVCSPQDCWLLLRGIKTLAVRMPVHCENALKIAKALESHKHVTKVLYPGLTSHPDHALASRQMRGFGGMLAFEVEGGAAQAKKVAESTEIILLAESLGGVESLIGYPPMMSHATMSEEQRQAKGIPPNLLRLSVGIEDAEDLIHDLNCAIENAYR